MAASYSLVTLQSIRNQLVANLEEVTATPKPTYSVDGQSVKWDEHVANLTTQIDWLTEKIERLDSGTYLFEEAEELVP